MRIIKFGGFGYASNSYLVTDDSREQAIVIDPSMPLDWVAEQYHDEPKISAVLLTHGHFDHILELQSYVDAGIPVSIGEQDEPLLTDGYKNASRVFFGEDTVVSVGGVRTLRDGDAVKIGAEEISVIHTPGHTAGSVCYVGKDAVFSGDTLFAHGGYGRYDLYSGDFEQLKRSIRRLLSLCLEQRICPGHGCDSDISTEKKYYRDI